MLLYALFLCPLIAALLSLGARKTAVLDGLAVLAALAEFAAGSAAAWRVAFAGSYAAGSLFAIDAFGAILLLIVATIGLATTVFSVGYLREEVAKGIIGFRRVRQYFVLLHLFVMAMVVAAATTSPVMMWIALEATTLATAFLISFYNKPSSMEAAWKYLIINSIGLLLGFLGTLLFLTAAGEGRAAIATWAGLFAGAAKLNPLVAKIAFVFAFIGYGTKVGLAPMHTWKPDAYSKAPAPIGALFSGPLLAIAMYALLKWKAVTDIAIGPDFARSILVFFGAASVLVAALIILSQKNYKRLFAYSSIEHAGIMALGFAWGGAGALAAILHLVYHSLAKAVLFFSSGNLLLKFGSARINNAKGVLNVLPATGFLLILGFLAITGVPPFGLFVTEFMILSSGMAAHPAVVIAVTACLAVIFAGFLRHTVRMAYSEAPSEIKRGEASLWTVVPPTALALLLIILSVYLPAPFRSLIDTAAAALK